MKVQHFSSQIRDLAFQICRNFKLIVFFTIYIIVSPLMEATEDYSCRPSVTGLAREGRVCGCSNKVYRGSAACTPKGHHFRVCVYMNCNVITLWSNQCMPHSHAKLYSNNHKHAPLSSTLARPVRRGLHNYQRLQMGD